VDRITRKGLKQDRFARDVGQTVEYVSEHRAQVTRYGIVALALVVLIGGFLGWRRHQRVARQEALAAALDIQQTPLGAPTGDSGRIFATEEERTKAELAAFTDLAARYSGSEEGTIAEYFVGTLAARQGNFSKAEKLLKQVAQSGASNYAALARLALAEICKSQGRLNEAESLIRGLVDKPTEFVSREEATIALARVVAMRSPAEARKLLEPLRTTRPAIGRAAIAELSELPTR
jgi:predicted negative regulator of RcsB-dependent stress response